MYASRYWNSIASPSKVQNFVECNLSDSIKRNLSDDFRDHVESDWEVLWVVSVWRFWRWRNFMASSIDFKKHLNPKSLIFKFPHELKWNEDPNLHDSRDDEGERTKAHWQKLPTSWVKMNSDVGSF